MSAPSALRPRRAKPGLQGIAKLLVRRPRLLAHAAAALLVLVLAAMTGVLSPLLILVGAAAAAVYWICRVWWPRQVAGILAPGSPLTGRRFGLRLRSLPLDPISAGIAPTRTILGRRRGRFVQARHRIATLVVGPPQVGKTTGVIVPNVMAWLGSVVVTSTKRDVLDACAAVRARRGTAWCFDPLGVVGPPPAGVRQLLWSPLTGCAEWDVAARHAAALAVNAGRDSEDAHHWRDRGTQLLAALMQAAALGGSPMSTLCEWVHSGMSAPAEAILERQSAPQARSRLDGVMRNTAPRERTSIWSVVAGCLRPFDDSRVLASADAAAGCDFDPAGFLDGANTVFIVAPSDGAVSLAPLVVGLVEEVRLAGLRISDELGRLPIPLLLALDEVANICPLPGLPAILSEGGGRNMVLLLAFQDITQAADRWGLRSPAVSSPSVARSSYFRGCRIPRPSGPSRPSAERGASGG